MDSFYTTITDPDQLACVASVAMRQSNRRQSTPAAMPSMEFRSKRMFKRVSEHGESVDEEC